MVCGPPGPQKSESGVKLDYETGEVLATFPARRACTRATGCADSIFYRASGGTVRVLTDTNTAQHIDPMRPPCQDGVMSPTAIYTGGPGCVAASCRCTATSDFVPTGPTPDHGDAAAASGQRLIVGEDASQPSPLAIQAGDWPTYRARTARNDVSTLAIPEAVKLQWTAEVCGDALPTAPVTAGGLVFVADRRGVVQAFDRDGHSLWKAYTSGPIYYPPTVAHDRLFVGSADGRVYAFAATNGDFLWSFRVGPSDDRIAVYDHLISAWPVAGGVVVDGDTVYAAAGITHYDGTHVVALDAISGKMKASNSDSGTLEQEVNNGISLQGNLTIVDGELRFLAGGVYETAQVRLAHAGMFEFPRGAGFVSVSNRVLSLLSQLRKVRIAGLSMPRRLPVVARCQLRRKPVREPIANASLATGNAQAGQGSGSLGTTRWQVAGCDMAGCGESTFHKFRGHRQRPDGDRTSGR